MDTSPICVESQADWLTASAYGRDRTAYFNLLASTIAVAEGAHGDRDERFQLNGYRGYRIGRLRYGERENAGLIQLSGELAATWFDDVYAHADHVTRLDVAVTVDTGVADELLGMRSYSEAYAFHLEHPRSALPSHHGDADGGWTTYLGHRSSDWYFRLYNKEAECLAHGDKIGAGQYARCWRYELEAKGIASTVLAGELYKTLRRTDYVRQFVARWVQEHGITPVFPLVGDVAKLSGLRRRSDRDTRLNWLKTSVAPTVQWLLNRGDRDLIVELLGLQPPAPPDSSTSEEPSSTS